MSGEEYTLERKFNDAACERLVRAERRYCDEHGGYIPELATLLLRTRKSVPTPGSVLLSPEQVAQVREKRETCPLDCCHYHLGFASGLDFVLALLDAPKEEK